MNETTPSSPSPAPTVTLRVDDGPTFWRETIYLRVHSTYAGRELSNQLDAVCRHIPGLIYTPILELATKAIEEQRRWLHTEKGHGLNLWSPASEELTGLGIYLDVEPHTHRVQTYHYLDRLLIEAAAGRIKTLVVPSARVLGAIEVIWRLATELKVNVRSVVLEEAGCL